MKCDTMEQSLFLEKLRSVEKNERLFYLEGYLKDIFGKYFYIENHADIPAEASFFELGLTSLGAVEIKYELEKTLKISLDSTVIFNFPTINKLLQFLSTQKLSFLFNTTEEIAVNSFENEKEYAKKMLQKDFCLE